MNHRQHTLNIKPAAYRADWLDYMLCSFIGIGLAAALVAWWSS